ncbi:MAG: hypothetical protein A2039_01060 [Candidatus Melainabacteria bacterium GWA2_34_9]|nr:MAG: hypothetical protein A2039_01060 [Candidatus Melainabacteria bacterium GWA2_34_9]
MTERHDYEERKVTRFANLAYGGIKILDVSCKFKNPNYNPQTKSAIFALWHGWQYGLLGVPSRNDLHLLISPSLDGEIIARVTEKLGFSTVRGSMKRDGSKALRELLKVLKSDKAIAYTVDGPKGPICKVKEGVIKIAQMSQKPIIPLVPTVNWKIEINSWDKYKIPFPFATVKNLYGEPIYVPKKLSDKEVEEYRLNLENELFRLQQETLLSS